MSTPDTIRAVIDLWPTRRDLATDVGVTQDRVHKWAQAGAIPAKYHFGMIAAGQTRGFDITADLLTQLHASSANEEAA